MTAWKLTAGLQNLLDQINAFAPGRDHASDGTIGDAAHQAEVSGHNPDDTAGSKAEWNGDPDSDPEVRALDVDSDFRNGVTAQTVVDHIRALRPSSVLRYMIYNRVIYTAAAGWQGAPYTGASAHTEHVHFSGAYSQASDNDTTYNYRLEEIPVALTDDDKAFITAQIATVTARDAAQADGTPTSKVGRLALDQGIPDGTAADEDRDYAWAVLRNLGRKLLEVEGKVDALAPTPGVKSATL